jgi:hypothetical protein
MPAASAETAKNEPEFPLENYRDAARHMRRPFTAAAIKFKVQTTWPKGEPTSALIVCYIDARLVVERLNLLLPDKWEDEYQQVDATHMICRLTVDGINRRDLGEGSGKALWSDAFKRAAVKFGIGVSCYAIPKMIQTGDNVSQRGRGEKKTLVLTSDGEAAVRNIYGMWLQNRATAAFGDPLDHGDVDESQGDWEAEAAIEARAERGDPPPALDDERASTQRTQAEALFEELKKLDSKAMLRAAFDAYLVSAEHSHDRLDDFLTYLRGKIDETKAAKS